MLCLTRIVRRLIRANRSLYQNSPHHQKAKVVKAVVQAVHENGGRFLEKPIQPKACSVSEPQNKKIGARTDTSDTGWYQVSFQRALTKTAQALRERERSVTKPPAVAMALSNNTVFGAGMPLVVHQDLPSSSNTGSSTNQTPFHHQPDSVPSCSQHTPGTINSHFLKPESAMTRSSMSNSTMNPSNARDRALCTRNPTRELDSTCSLPNSHASCIQATPFLQQQEEEQNTTHLAAQSLSWGNQSTTVHPSKYSCRPSQSIGWEEASPMCTGGDITKPIDELNHFSEENKDSHMPLLGSSFSLCNQAASSPFGPNDNDPENDSFALLADDASTPRPPRLKRQNHHFVSE